MRSARDRKTAARAGLSRTEVIAVLVCLVFLIAVLVPMIAQRREEQRRVACQDRLRNLGKSFEVSLEEHAGAYPWLVDNTLSWTAVLIPYLPDGETYAEQLANLAVDDTFTIPEYLCPNGRNYERGANSYVGNGGFGDFRDEAEGHIVFEDTPHSQATDWDGDGEVTEHEIEISRGTGIFWRNSADPPSVPVTIDFVKQGDGASNTLLLSENQNARRWRSAETFDLAFVVGRDRIPPFTSRPPQIESGHEIDLGPYRINALLSGKPGQTPAPSSTHAGGVNALFADGSVRFLAEKIDPLIFLRAMTPVGDVHRNHF